VDADRVVPVRLAHHVLERLEVGVFNEQVHPSDRSVQQMMDQPAGRGSRCSWHG